MAGKRRATEVTESDSEGDSSPETTPAKRAKHEDNVEIGNVTKQGPSNAQDDDDDVKEEEEDRRFEEENEEAIRAQVQRKSKHQGGIAEMGIIESLELHQFMCHKYLTFSFGPQVNFIIGHNGSGKSAVLSSITVALGGKATSTGRGSGLKSFIREGQSVSEVSISLKNQGEEAYKPELYGKSIIITRRFTKEGSSSYKIKSKDGRVISTKREELAAICDHMNIQVDNPMNILTQDSARQFLSASHPSDKYKFFLKGTQLQQLSDEYDTCLENISQTAKVLQGKKENIGDLRGNHKEKLRAFEEASKAREQKHKVDQLKKEMAWAHVASKEEEMKKKLEEVEKMKRRLPKVKEAVDAADAAFRASSEQVGILESQLQEMGNMENLTTRKTELANLLKANRAKIAELKNEEKKMNASLERWNSSIKEYDTKIAAEKKKLEEKSQAKHDEIDRKLKDAQDQLRNAEQELSDVRKQKSELNAELDRIAKEGEQLQKEREEEQKEIGRCQEAAEAARRQENNSLAAFGNNMKQVVEMIKNARWMGQMPVGPLGVHVQVKDPQRWAPILRMQLGGLMSSFAITDARDRAQLKKILDQTNNSHCTITISKFDLFDFSAGEPPPNVLTVLRALEVSDEYVLRLLVNAASVERTVLAEDRAEGDAVLRNLRSGVAWTRNMYRVQRYGEGGGQSVPLGALKNTDRRQHLFTGRDTAAQIAHYNGLVREAEGRYTAVVAELQDRRQKHSDCKKAIIDLQKRETELHGRAAALKMTINELQNELSEDNSTTIGALEEAKNEAVVEKENIKTQFENVERQKRELDDAQVPLLTEQNAIKKQLSEFADGQADLNAQIQEQVVKRMDAQKNKDYYLKKLDEEQKKVDEANGQAETLQVEFQTWTEGAEKYCERVENPRPKDVVERNLNSVQAALKERERKAGKTVEEVTEELTKARTDLENAERDLKQMTALNKALKASLVIRLAKWHEFRRHIALRCKVVFQYHLSNRGYYGKVLFDHQNGTLQLKVQTDDQAGTQSRDKDPRSLSGGEKSFSTICLLLSLWEAIGCPIRCLDEFDVFMDAVNRRISMKMMIDTANSSDGKQYILITPQDMNNVAVTNTVRVHRMSDPERGQGVLAFS